MQGSQDPNEIIKNKFLFGNNDFISKKKLQLLLTFDFIKNFIYYQELYETDVLDCMDRAR